MTMKADNAIPGTPRSALLRNVFRQAPTKPGQTYGVPGEGNTIRISVAALLSVLALWQIVTASGLIAPLFLPSPVAVAEKFFALVQNGYTNAPLLQHILVSAARVFAAFALACVIGIPLGLGMGMSTTLRGLFDPFLEFYRPIPPLAYLPLMIIWFGIGETSKILLIFLSVLAPVALGARAGVRSVAIEQIHAAYSLGATRAQVLREVVLPSAFPEILTAMRIGVGFGWTTLVAAEMVAATQGLGYMVLSASQFLQTSTVLVGIILIGGIAWIFDLAMRWVEKRLVPWKGRM
ncbi:ABC transporter permease subunit [Tropicimonas aquimaris]|uniref:ABC transporter permease subunit n=1 Tax=Tropicimonas aquimaris TaxID=914152 RepID=A0ABW3IQP9_9RHOB